MSHHEWFNGSGYPDGVEALDIPLGARILTIADAYEAMTSSRPVPQDRAVHEIAIGELEKFSGIQFDPDIVPILVGLDRETLDRPPERSGRAADHAPRAGSPRPTGGGCHRTDATAQGHPRGNRTVEAIAGLRRCSLASSRWRWSSAPWLAEASPAWRTCA